MFKFDNCKISNIILKYRYSDISIISIDQDLWYRYIDTYLVLFFLFPLHFIRLIAHSHIHTRTQPFPAHKHTIIAHTHTLAHEYPRARLRCCLVFDFPRKNVAPNRLKTWATKRRIPLSTPWNPSSRTSIPIRAIGAPFTRFTSLFSRTRGASRGHRFSANSPIPAFSHNAFFFPNITPNYVVNPIREIMGTSRIPARMEFFFFFFPKSLQLGRIRFANSAKYHHSVLSIWREWCHGPCFPGDVICKHTSLFCSRCIVICERPLSRA